MKETHVLFIHSFILPPFQITIYFAFYRYIYFAMHRDANCVHIHSKLYIFVFKKSKRIATEGVSFDVIL